jgi:glycosyltransferase involved in cell wall biosynthesis
MKKYSNYSGKVAIQQKVVSDYRAVFFERLAESCSGGVEVFAGDTPTEPGTQTVNHLHGANLYNSKNLHFLQEKVYSLWQKNFTSWLKRHRPDVLLVEANPRILSNYQGYRLMKKWNRPVIGWGLGSLDWDIPVWMLSARKSFFRQFYKCFDLMIAYSNKGADDYIACGVPKERVFIAPNSVCAENAERTKEKIEQNPTLVEQFKKTNGFSDKPIIMFAGRLIPSKRVNDLIEACSVMKSDYQLLIVGDGPDRLKLENLAKKLHSNVRFLGYQSGEELAFSFSVADLFVLPGSGGLAVQEAMIYGKPVIVASADGTQTDLVREGENGFHATPGDIPALSQTINESLKHRSRLSEMGKESRRIVTEEFNLNIMAQTFINAFNFVSTRNENPAEYCKSD